MALRTYGRLKTGYLFYSDHDTLGVPVDTVSYRPATWVDFHNGVEQPSWRRLIAMRANATTGASWERRDFNEEINASFIAFFKFWNGSSWQTYRTIERSKKGRGLTRPLIPTDGLLPPDEADVAARTKFLQKIRSIQTAFKGGTFLGELRETLRLIRRPAEALRRGIDDYVRDAKKAYRRSSRARRSKALSGTWLEYQFGWIPLVNDIADLSKAASSQASEIHQIIVDVSGSSEFATSWVLEDFTDSFHLICDVGRTYKTEVRYKAGVSILNPLALPQMRKYGLDWSNFVPTVWELIPYSFLVDYFSNIGNLIDSACVSNFIVDWGCKNIKQTGSETLSNLHQPGLPIVADDFEAKDTGTGVQSYTNTVTAGSRSSFMNVDVGLADLQFKVPLAGSTKWLNIAALANQRRV